MREIFDAYMHSNTWKKVRSIVIKRFKGRCRSCDCKPRKKIVHHKSYHNWGKGNLEEIMDCELLCKKCHDAEHILMNPETIPFFARRTFYG